MRPLIRVHTRSPSGSGPVPLGVTAPVPGQAGVTLWLKRNTFAGSWRFFTAASRS